MPGSAWLPWTGIADTAARAMLDRVTPQQTKAFIDAGGLVVDTRTQAQRRQTGQIPGAVVIDRPVLEWCPGPDCPFPGLRT
jgi:hypothetical protein